MIAALPPHPSAEQRTALVRVVLDLADDLGYPCAVAVIDGDGRLLSAERDPRLPAADFERALGVARDALRSGTPAHGHGASALPLADGVRLVGAVGAGGGPPGFASEAVAAAVRAAGLGTCRGSGVA